MEMSQARLWLIIGFTGQALFSARFLVQWIASERRRDSVVPVAFWWLSLLGGLTLLSYASYKQDPVIIVGQGMGLVVYARNLMLVGKAKRHAARHSHRPHRDRDRDRVVVLEAEETPRRVVVRPSHENEVD
jgi:lipid-A-disaccharide synthase-like uncharacterized protein